MSHNHEMMPEWIKVSSAIILTLLIINGYIQKYLNTRKMRIEKMSFQVSLMKELKQSGSGV